MNQKKYWSKIYVYAKVLVFNARIFSAKKKRHPGGAAFRLVNLENMRTIIKELTLHFDLQLFRYEQICRLQNRFPKSYH